MYEVVFKSTPENFDKEETGLKSNTLRKVDMDDPRFKLLKLGGVGRVIIVNSETSEAFRREISDITFYEGWVIISWMTQGAN